MVSVWWCAIKGTFSREKKVGDFSEENKDLKICSILFIQNFKLPNGWISLGRFHLKSANVTVTTKLKFQGDMYKAEIVRSYF